MSANAKQLTRRVNQLLIGAQNLLKLAKCQSDRHLEDVLVSSALMQAELCFAFYVLELSDEATKQSVILPLSGSGIETMLASRRDSSSAEVLYLLHQTHSWLNDLLGLLSVSRQVNLVKSGLNNPLFSVEESPESESPDLIASTTGAVQAESAALIINLQSVTEVIEELSNLVLRHRSNAAEY